MHGGHLCSFRPFRSIVEGPMGLIVYKATIGHVT